MERVAWIPLALLRIGENRRQLRAVNYFLLHFTEVDLLPAVDSLAGKHTDDLEDDVLDADPTADQAFVRE